MIHHHCIYWGKCSAPVRRHICSLIGIRPILTVNGTTYAGVLSQEQLSTLQPYVDRKDIQVRTFT